MPQLDSIYIFLVFAWTWLALYLIAQKIKTLQVSSGPKKNNMNKPNKSLPTLPWT